MRRDSLLKRLVAFGEHPCNFTGYPTVAPSVIHNENLDDIPAVF